jgi:hypothetical protein
MSSLKREVGRTTGGVAPPGDAMPALFTRAASPRREWQHAAARGPSAPEGDALGADRVVGNVQNACGENATGSLTVTDRGTINLP